MAKLKLPEADQAEIDASRHMLWGWVVAVLLMLAVVVIVAVLADSSLPLAEGKKPSEPVNFWNDVYSRMKDFGLAIGAIVGFSGVAFGHCLNGHLILKREAFARQRALRDAAANLAGEMTGYQLRYQRIFNIALHLLVVVDRDKDERIGDYYYEVNSMIDALPEWNNVETRFFSNFFSIKIATSGGDLFAINTKTIRSRKEGVFKDSVLDEGDEIRNALLWSLQAFCHLAALQAAFRRIAIGKSPEISWVVDDFEMSNSKLQGLISAEMDRAPNTKNKEDNIIFFEQLRSLVDIQIEGL